MQSKDEIRDVVKEVLRDELRGLMEDISWRMQSVADLSVGKVPAELLDLKQPILTGYTVDSDSPTVGSIEWTDVNIVYQGNVYGPFSGDTTDKYVWFDLSDSDIKTGNSKPSLDDGDALVFVNDDGEVTEAVNSRGQIHGGQAKDASIAGSEVAANAIEATHVLENSLGDDHVTDLSANKILGQLDDDQIADLAAGKITGTLTSSQIDSITSGQIDGTLDDAQIDSLDAAKVFGTLNGGQVGPGIDGSNLDDGTVTTSRLDTLHHMLF